jgi:hypothetical protein
MSGKTIMNAAVLLVSGLLLVIGVSCVSVGDTHHTYRLKGAPLDNERFDAFIFWRSSYSDYGQWLVVPNSAHKIVNERESAVFGFTIVEEGCLEGKPLGETERMIYTEPFNLLMAFSVADNTKKIMVNKLIFRSRSKVIDLRDIVGISYSPTISNYHYIWFSDEEIMDFRKYGTIDLTDYHNEERAIYGISFNYDNVDVLFNKDQFFVIECDMTFESDSEGYTPRNYSFTARFNRKKYAEETISWATFLLLYAYAGGF